MKNLSKYVKGQMNESEMESFTQKLLDEKFGEEDKTRWANILAEKHHIKRNASPKPNAGRRIKPLFARVGAIAATFTLLVAAFFLLRQSPIEIADAYLANNKLEYGSIRKSLTNVADLRLNAGQAYEAKEYPEAIDTWKEVLQKDQPIAEDYFYLGLSYLHNQQMDQAIESLLKARPLSVEEARFVQEINWFLSLAYVKNKEPQKALAELNKIQSNDWNYDKAVQLIRKLEK